MANATLSGVENLKFLKNQKLGFLFGYKVERNLFILVVRDYIVENLTNASAA
jgi:hypothetical protein